MKSSNSGLMFPKPVRKKKKMKHKASILDTEKGICYICDKLYGDRSYKYTEYHHIMYGGGKRVNSEEFGLTAYLCEDHHRDGPEAVHSNHEMREYLCRQAQEAFEREHTREEWVNMDFKDYLSKMPENVDFTKCRGQFEEMKTLERVSEEEPDGAAGNFKVGEYIAYLWGETIEYGYILEIGEAGTVWVGEELDAWFKRLVEIPAILR